MHVQKKIKVYFFKDYIQIKVKKNTIKVNCGIYTYIKCHLMENFMKILHSNEFVQQIYT